MSTAAINPLRLIGSLLARWRANGGFGTGEARNNHTTCVHRMELELLEEWNAAALENDRSAVRSIRIAQDVAGRVLKSAEAIARDPWEREGRVMLLSQVEALNNLLDQAMERIALVCLLLVSLGAPVMQSALSSGPQEEDVRRARVRSQVKVRRRRDEEFFSMDGSVAA